MVSGPVFPPEFVRSTAPRLSLVELDHSASCPLAQGARCANPECVDLGCRAVDRKVRLDLVSELSAIAVESPGMTGAQSGAEARRRVAEKWKSRVGGVSPKGESGPVADPVSLPGDADDAFWEGFRAGAEWQKGQAD